MGSFFTWEQWHPQNNVVVPQVNNIDDSTVGTTWLKLCILCFIPCLYDIDCICSIFFFMWSSTFLRLFTFLPAQFSPSQPSTSQVITIAFACHPFKDFTCASKILFLVFLLFFNFPSSSQTPSSFFGLLVSSTFSLPFFYPLFPCLTFQTPRSISSSSFYGSIPLFHSFLIFSSTSTPFKSLLLFLRYSIISS